MSKISKPAIAALVLPFIAFIGVGLWSPPGLAVAAPKPALAGGLSFSEKQVAGGPSDFMTVRHIKMAGGNRDIGKKLAEIAKTTMPSPFAPPIRPPSAPGGTSTAATIPTTSTARPA